MIKRFRVRNFKNLADTGTIEFGPINALIGHNGAGKSSLLQAIDFLRAFFESSVEVYINRREWDYRDLPNLRKHHTKMRWDADIEVPLGYGGSTRTYRYSVELLRRRYFVIGQERLVRLAAGSDAEEEQVLLDREGRTLRLFNAKTQTEDQFRALALPASAITALDGTLDSEYPELIAFMEHVRAFRSFLFWDPKVLRKASRGTKQELGPSGEDLASVLAYLRDSRPREFERVTKRIRRLFPTVSDLSLKGGKGWGWKEIQLHESNGGDVVYNSQQVSDGILRMLAVITFLHIGKTPPVLSLEEPENGVHPALIAEVVQLLRELTLRKAPSRSQVFFTTHSPYVLDEFLDAPEQVYVVERGRPQEGGRVWRLHAAQQFDAVKQGMGSLGEAWLAGLLRGPRR